MLDRFRHYRLLIVNLGLWQFLFYKLQQLRLHFLHVQDPVSLFSKHAMFPLQFRPNTSDHAVFFQVFVHREYRCLDGLQEVKLIIDCGANVGYTSACLLSRFPDAQVIAVEPDPENFVMLEANLSRYVGRYRTIRSAVWSHATDLVISGKERGSEWARSVKPASPEGVASADYGAPESATVVATDIGTLFVGSGCARISILKIDIEGAEEAVFSSNYENWIKNVDNLVIELHGERCTAVFEKAIAAENFLVSRCGELTVCTRS